MEQNKRTLAHIVSSTSSSQNPQQTQGQIENTPQTINSYLTVFSINLVHRFPDVSDLNNIDYNDVKNLAEFSLACSTIATEVWNQTGFVQNQQSRQYMKRTA